MKAKSEPAEDPHGVRVAYWGGPIDGTEIVSDVDLRHLAPPKWSRGYKRYEVAQHKHDLSYCYVVYVWREVWGP